MANIKTSILKQVKISRFEATVSQPHFIRTSVLLLKQNSGENIQREPVDGAEDPRCVNL